ncbi:MAG: hypothetical protein C5B50_09345 [Verrucomicrobia bacterium]|nr:MAG: hypothetical protein C5B50_09345 [Verrucomicrobiota bacterium]
MPKEPRDAIRPWFSSAEAVGEFIGIRFGRVRPGSSEPEWTFLPHSEVDGIGGLAKILRERGAEVGRLLQLKHPAGPSALCAVRAFPKYLKPRRPLKWLEMERGPALPDIGPQPPPAVAWHAFSEPTTVQIRRVCRKGGVTVNSFLLKHLTKAIRPFLQDQSSVVPWMVPVNLRGKVSRGSDIANHSSYVGVRVKSYETVKNIHKNIYAALGRGEHWANWFAYHTGPMITEGMRRFLITKGLAMSQWNLGGFSNLGEWDAEKKINNPDCTGDWFFSPPVLRCQLVGAGCVTFQNRLTLTIQAHPDLTTSPKVPKAWLANWLKEIEMDISEEPAYLTA